ncbi:hypothetical protein Q7A53_06235 [Halobacillus rhizosphaerae]|uniref:DUF4376 domain-containing protein n=1 Tax=Halobacillus rhizosphaerae TaxID=3064889 RepID=UPI00398AB5F8
MQIGLTTIEMKLLEHGIKSFSTKDMNDLVSVIANKESKSFIEVTSDYLLDYHKKLKINWLTEMSDETVMNGFESSNGHIYRTEGGDQFRMLATMVVMMINQNLTSINWKTEDAGYLPLSKEEFTTVFLEGFQHAHSTLEKYNTLKSNVENATTDDEILSITW